MGRFIYIFSTRKKIFWTLYFYLVFTSKVESQPFLNSLAVLFRAKAAFPTTFPSDPIKPSVFKIFPTIHSTRKSPSQYHYNNNQIIPAPILAAAAASGSKNGFFVAHPINVARFPPDNPSPPKFISLPPPPPTNEFVNNNNEVINLQSYNQIPITIMSSTTSKPKPPKNKQKADISNFIHIPQPLATSQSSVNGNFKLPDPPTAPDFQSMNSNSIASPASSSLLETWPTKKSSTNTQQQDSQVDLSTGTDIFSQFNSLTSYNTQNYGAGVRTSKMKSSKPTKSAYSSVGTKKANNIKLLEYPKPTPPDDFRPSPQISTFYETTIINAVEKQPESTTSVDGFEASEARNQPRFESGFRPVFYPTSYQYAPRYSVNPHDRSSTTTSYNYYNPWANHQHQTSSSSIVTTKVPFKKSHRTNRKIVNGDGDSVVTTSASYSVDDSSSSSSSSQEDNQRQNEIKSHVTTSSSEVMENWIHPLKKTKKVLRAPVYIKKKSSLKPSSKCEKFHRFGFCPVTNSYPLSHVEKIAKKCSALLQHLISPLPKTDIHYNNDLVLAKNESSSTGVHTVLKGRSSKKVSGNSRRWSWRSYKGKPVCDTEELRIVPAWAKDGNGDWLLILQTNSYKQEAQISLCSPPTHCLTSNCKKKKKKVCLQRFSAQRLAVLDPDDHDRCPVIRSVFLPSACVCLSSDVNEEDEERTEEDFLSDFLERDTEQKSSSSNIVPVITLPDSKANKYNISNSNKDHDNHDNHDKDINKSKKKGTIVIISEKVTTNESSSESSVSSSISSSVS